MTNKGMFMKTDVRKLSYEKLFESVISYLATRSSTAGQMIAELNETKRRFKIMQEVCKAADLWSQMDKTNKAERSYNLSNAVATFRAMEAEQNAYDKKRKS